MPARVGVEVPHRPELLGPVAVRAEALGFDSVWIGDHVAFYNATLDCLLGPPAACLEQLDRFAAAGVRTFVIYFTVPSERVLEQLERFGTEVLPHVPDRVEAGVSPPVAWRT